MSTPTQTQQLAREMAEKLGEKLVGLDLSGIHNDLTTTTSKLFARIILSELNLDQLLADKERLEYLWDLILHDDWRSVPENVRNETAKDFREAIDNAMKKGK